MNSGRDPAADARDIQQVIDHELALLTPQVRRSAQQLDELLDPDFREIGASGRRWTRSETISALSAETAEDGQVAATEFEATVVSTDVILLTFMIVGRARRARRSSLWRRSDGRWRVLHHQGTVLPPP